MPLDDSTVLQVLQPLLAEFQRNNIDKNSTVFINFLRAVRILYPSIDLDQLDAPMYVCEFQGCEVELSWSEPQLVTDHVLQHLEGDSAPSSLAQSSSALPPDDSLLPSTQENSLLDQTQESASPAFTNSTNSAENEDNLSESHSSSQEDQPKADEQRSHLSSVDRQPSTPTNLADSELAPLRTTRRSCRSKGKSTTNSREKSSSSEKADNESSTASVSVKRTRKRAKSSKPRKFPCRQCGKELSSPRSLVIHQRIHSGERPFSCSWKGCNKSFPQQAHLQAHERSHTGEKPFECSWNCGKSFSQQSHQLTHERIHKGVKEYVCKVENCGKSYYQAGNLRVHERTHNIGDPATWRVTCPECGKVLGCRATLVMHLKTHTGNKPFKCSFEGCDMRFYERSSRRFHEKIHTGEKPWKCSWEGCGKFFRRKTHQIQHERIVHVGEKLFTCSWKDCGRSFGYKNDLIVHERTHTGEKPYKCPQPNCDKSFVSSAKVLVHIRKHTGEKRYACPTCKKRFTKKKYCNIQCRQCRSSDHKKI